MQQRRDAMAKKRSKRASKRSAARSSRRKARAVSTERGAQPKGMINAWEDDPGAGSRPKTRSGSAGSAVPDPDRQPVLCAGGEASSARNRGISLLGGRRSIAARRRFLGGPGAGDPVGSGRGPAGGPRFRRRPQRVLRPRGAQVFPWLGGGTHGLFRREPRHRVP